MKNVRVKVLPGEYFYTPECGYKYIKTEKACTFCDSIGNLSLADGREIKCTKCNGKGAIKTEKVLNHWNPSTQKCTGIELYISGANYHYYEQSGWSQNKKAVNQSVVFEYEDECKVYCDEKNATEKWKVL